MLRRFTTVLAAVLVALALAAVPAFAQDDDDDDDDGAGAPEGGIQTGAGGTAGSGPDEALLGLGAGSLLLVATAGGLALRRRAQGSPW